MVILPDAPPVINIGTQVSLCVGTVLCEGTHAPFSQSLLGNTFGLLAFRRGTRSHSPGAHRWSRYVSQAAVMIQFTVGRRPIC